MIRRIITIGLVFALAMQAYSQSSAESRYAEHSALASGKWVKIRVKDEGVYAITKSKLQKMGFSNPEKVSLYGYNLPILPEAKIENISDDMTEIPVWRRSDGSLLFYSFGTTKWQRKNGSTTTFTRINNPYSSYIYYFVTEQQEGQPATMSKENVSLDSSIETTVTFPEHSIIEKDEVSIINSGRTFYENYNYLNGNKKTYTLSTEGIADPSVSLNVQFVGTNGSTLTVTADSTSFSPVSIRNAVEYEYGIQVNRTFTFKKALAETSKVTLTHTRGNGISGYLDYIIASYTRKLDMTGNDYLAFRSSDSYSTENKYAISGANENTRVWRVTSPQQTCELEGTLGNGAYTVLTDQDAPTHEYVAVNINANFPEPDIVGTIQNQDLHALSNIDLVIIVPANNKLTAQAQRLADAHTKYDSLRCVVVRADEIYNEFSSGTPDATAYRRFMKMLYDKAETEADRPKNLCLFGDGVWDNRMVTTTMTKKDPDDYLLCYESDNSLHHTDSYVLEEYYTLLADNKGISPLKEKPDCGVGRITVMTVNEARSVVDKLIGYIDNSHAGAWKNTICIMADDGNANTHIKDADAVAKQVEALYPNYRMRKIYWDAYNREESGAGHSYPDARKDIVNQISEGALIMNYTGHGSAYTLSHEQVISRSDFAEWDSPNLPLWFIAACDVTPFDMNVENIAETALQNSKGAAVGMITTTRTVYAAQNSKINQAFMKSVLAQTEGGRQYTLGEALAKAKSDLIGRGALSHRDSLNKVHYVLIGDPAIALPIPTYKVKVDKVNDIAVEDTVQTISAGSIVSVQGHIVDEDGNEAPYFNGLITPTIFDNLEFITCNNNAKEDVTPFQFYAHTRTLFAGSDSIKQGKFDFTFPVPLDINYSDENGLMCFYAINAERNIEANGNFQDFLIGGTDSNISNNTVGPVLVATLNGEKFSNVLSTDSIISNVIQTTNVPMHETPYFLGVIQDENGINATGSGIGHEITIIVDNDPNMTYDLNRTFKYATGTWTTGSVYCNLPELSKGRHTLLFRAWDVLNNPSTLEIEFDVYKGLKPNLLSLQINTPGRNNMLSVVIENDRPNSALNIDVRIYDMSGRELWRGGETGVSASNFYTYTCNLNEMNGHLQPGIYICKASISTGNGAQASESKKFAVTAQ